MTPSVGEASREHRRSHRVDSDSDAVFVLSPVTAERRSGAEQSRSQTAGAQTAARTGKNRIRI